NRGCLPSSRTRDSRSSRPLSARLGRPRVGDREGESLPTELVEELRDEARPAPLVRSAQTLSRVSVEVLVEEDQILPVRVVSVDVDAVEDGPLSGLIQQEDPRQPLRELSVDLSQREHLSRAGRAFDLEVVAEVLVIAAEGLEDQVVDREPDRTAPVRVAS